MEEQQPGLFLCSEDLPDGVESVVNVDAKTRQHLLLSYVNGLGMPLTTSAMMKNENETYVM